MGKVLVVGAGLAGSEAALYLASKGIEVVLAEGKTLKLNPAQKMKTYAELVCTNSLKSIKPTTGHGLLKREMKAFNSVVLEVGHKVSVPAGDALAVDREIFSEVITKKLRNHHLIEVIEEEVTNPLEFMDIHKCTQTIIATGPLTTGPLEQWIQKNISHEDFYFYDAIAPVVDGDTLDYSKLYFKDRYKEDSGEKADYLNAPFTKEQYYEFVEALREAEKVPAKDFEDLIYFENCLPIDVMAERGIDTPRFSCMKPVGLEQEGQKRPYAVVQLRRENLLGLAFNLVGLQTRLTYKEQVRIFRMIPGLENAKFIHLGSVHRNSFLNARKLLNYDMSSKEFSNIYFAGQISGVEGYTESSMMGLYVADQIYRKIKGLPAVRWPVETATGALVNYLMTAERPSPSSINFGLLPSIELLPHQRKGRDKKKIRKELVAQRALEVFEKFYDENYKDNQ